MRGTQDGRDREGVTQIESGLEDWSKRQAVPQGVAKGKGKEGGGGRWPDFPAASGPPRGG